MYVFLAYAFAVFLFFVVDSSNNGPHSPFELPFLPQGNLATHQIKETLVHPLFAARPQLEYYCRATFRPTPGAI